MVTYRIQGDMAFFESDSRENPIVPHLDSEGLCTARFDSPYTILEGITMKIVGKTAILSMSGKKGNFTVVKFPVSVVNAMSSAVDDMTSDEQTITKEMREGVRNALRRLRNGY